MNSKEAAIYSKCHRVQEIMIDMFYPKFKFSKGDRVLDVGCGSGNFTSLVANAVTSIVGLDVSKDMIEYAQQHYQPDNVEYVICDAQDFGTNLPTWKNQFDKVVCMNVLHWVKDKKKAIQNIQLCLKKGGELSVAVCGAMQKLSGNKRDELPFYLKNHPNWIDILKNYEHGLYNEMTITDWSNLLEMEGFSLVYKEVKSPCEEFTILNDIELEGYLRTLLRHLSFVPEERHGEFLQDAVEWCKRELPLNSNGIMYCPTEQIFIQATKK